MQHFQSFLLSTIRPYLRLKTMSCAVNDEILESLYEESLEEIEQFYKLKNKVVSVDQIDEEAIKLAMKRFEDLCQ